MNIMKHGRAPLAAYPIEVEFPDIRRWQHGGAIDYVHSADSGRPGPHVMLLALVHGNEVSGAIALDRLLAARLRPVAGRLTLGFANVAAYHTFDPHRPDANRYIDEDMNRVWSTDVLDGPRDSVELRRARALRPLIDSVDLLLDIHSMHEEAPPLMMCGPLAKGAALAAALGTPDYAVMDAGHANGRRLRDYGRFGDPAQPANALLIETGQHFSARSGQVALDTACRFLVHSGVVERAQVASWLSPDEPRAQQIIEITHQLVARSHNFAFAEDYTGMEVIEHAGTVIAHDDGEPFVTPYDGCVIVQPSLRQLAPGITVARLGRLRD
jgi:predicted deacylase